MSEIKHNEIKIKLQNTGSESEFHFQKDQMMW